MAHGEVVDFSYGAVGGLIEIADVYWHQIDGACARAGVDPLSLPFDRFLNLVYAWATEWLRADEEAFDNFHDALFEADIRRRGARGDNVSPEVIEEEMALFRAASTTLKTEMSRG